MWILTNLPLNYYYFSYILHTCKCLLHNSKTLLLLIIVLVRSTGLIKSSNFYYLTLFHPKLTNFFIQQLDSKFCIFFKSLHIRFRMCLVGVILRRMENEGEKSGEKMMFLVVWLRVEKRRDFGGAYKFSLLPLQNTFSPNWRENWVKIGKIFRKNYPHLF